MGCSQFKVRQPAPKRAGKPRGRECKARGGGRERERESSLSRKANDEEEERHYSRGCASSAGAGRCPRSISGPPASKHGWGAKGGAGELELFVFGFWGFFSFSFSFSFSPAPSLDRGEQMISRCVATGLQQYSDSIDVLDTDSRAFWRRC